MPLDAIARQREIYIRGAAGYGSLIPIDFPSLEAKAKKKMSREGYDYVKTGAGRESTVKDNRSAFDNYRIVPRMLRDVSQRSTKSVLLGEPVPAPMVLCPIGVLDLASSDGDLKTARAAERCQIPMVFSNQASASMEDCAKEMAETSFWMQIYWSKNDDLVRSFVKRAETSGCSALVFTLDTTLLGWRQRDLNNAYLPFLEGRGIAQYTSDPVFNDLLDRFKPESRSTVIGPRTLMTLWQLAKNYPGNTVSNLFRKSLSMLSNNLSASTHNRLYPGAT